MPGPGEPYPRTLTYVCFQATREGQASYAHVHEIVRGLERRQWTVNLLQPHYALTSGPVGMWSRFIECFRVQAKVMFQSRRSTLYVRWHPIGLPLLLWARFLRIPSVLEVNGGYSDAVLAYPALRPLAWLLTAIGRLCFHSPSALITVTSALQSWLEKESGGCPVYLIPNGANTDLFTPDAVPAEVFPWPYVIFVGALARWQGVDTAIAAAGRPEWPAAVRLVIVGDGPLREAVLEAARTNPKILYLGTQPYKTIPGMIARSIAGLVPSNPGEGRSLMGLSPLKLYETLACGVPAIVSRFPGQADFIQANNCGLVVPAEDPAALATAVRDLYQNPQTTREMGARARSAIVNGHSWDHRAGSTDAVLRSLAPGAN